MKQSPSSSNVYDKQKMSRLLGSKKSHTPTLKLNSPAITRCADSNQKQRYMQREIESFQKSEKTPKEGKPTIESNTQDEWKTDLRKGMIKAVDIWQSLLKTRESG